MIEERITRREIEACKREMLEQSILVTIEQSAEILAVSPDTVLRLVRNGRLPAYSENGPRSKGVRLLAAELREYVKSIKIAPERWWE